MASSEADVTEIANLLKRERFHRDTARWEMCRQAFHPDASKTYINVLWYEGEVEDFVKKSAEMHKGRVNVIHSSFDPVGISVRGSRATSEAFCTVTSESTIEGVDYELAAHMRLLSRLEKSEAGGWHMLSLEAIYVRDRLVNSLPGSNVTLRSDMIKQVEEYPRAYRSLALVMLHRGLKPRRKLPHEGDQTAVRLLLESNQAFLDSRGHA